MMLIVLFIVSPWKDMRENLRNFTNERSVESFYIAGFNVSNDKLCPFEGQGLTIFVMVNSNPKHFSQRIAIRNTWASFKYPEIKIGFMICMTYNDTINNLLEAENQVYNDIIRCNNEDTYETLTLKSLSMLEWIMTYCYNATFVLKVDDDMFVNLPKFLVKVYRNIKFTAFKIYGKVPYDEGFKVLRNFTHKSHVTKGEYFYKRYPPYARGPIYMIPVRLVKHLHKYGLKRQFFKLEDVFITGLVAKSLRIARANFEGLCTSSYTRVKYCLLNNTLALHVKNWTKMYSVWYALKNYNASICQDPKTRKNLII